MTDPESSPRRVVNFGGNVRFTPKHAYAPRTEAEVLAILDRHARGRVRVVGSRHSWNGGIASDDALVDLRHFDQLDIRRDADGTVRATVGGGCRLHDLLERLHRRTRHTIPSLGLITEQTIAGAISTATHGSGKHSMSHYVEEIRVAAFDETGAATIDTWRDGPELRAVRCAVGCLGVVLSVTFRCVPRYELAETIVARRTLADVLRDESATPLQQFYLIPHAWTFLVQRRAVATSSGGPVRCVLALLYRLWWLVCIDVGLHLVIKTMASVLRSGGLTRFFFRHLQTRLVVKNVTVTDAETRMLVMEHELFRHLEMEFFVPARHLGEATEFVRDVLSIADDAAHTPSDAVAGMLRRIGLLDDLRALRGTYTHHYPICYRRVLPDDTLLSPSSGDDGGAYYALSFITYVEPREPFFALATFLARSMARLFGARPHWGKFFPLDRAEVAALYPRLDEFRAVAERVDPHQVFRNSFTDRLR